MYNWFIFLNKVCGMYDLLVIINVKYMYMYIINVRFEYYSVYILFILSVNIESYWYLNYRIVI